MTRRCPLPRLTFFRPVLGATQFAPCLLWSAGISSSPAARIIRMLLNDRPSNEVDDYAWAETGPPRRGGGVGKGETGGNRNFARAKTMVGHVSRKAEVGLIGPGGDW